MPAPVIALAAGAAALGGLALLDRVANAVVKPVPRPPDEDIAGLAIPHEDVVIPSGDHALKGWLLRPTGEGHEAMVLLVHGWGASYGPLVHLAEPLLARGHPVLLFDIRGHGRNEAVPYVTARHFRDDILAATRFAEARFPDRRRVLVGHSMGGAGSVLAAAMGAPVHGLALIAAPADVLEVTADYLREKGMPGGLMVTILRPFWWRRVGGTFRELTPERKIREVELPLLIIQPERDRRVPRDQADRLAAAAGRPLTVIAGAGHTNVLEAEATHAALIDFLEAGRGC